MSGTWRHQHGEWCGPGGRHLLVAVYSRPWRRAFRKTFTLRCWECDLSIVEPPAGVSGRKS